MRRVAVTWFTPRNLVIWLIIVGVAGGALAGLLRLQVETAVESFLPSSDRSVTALEDNAKAFGGNPVVSVLESKQPQQMLLGEKQLPKLMRLEGKLSQLPDVATVYGPGTVMNQLAISSQDMLARLSGTRDGLRARAETEARDKGLSGSAVKAAGDDATAGFDQRYGSLLIRGLPGGLPTTKNPGFVKNVIYDQSGAPRARWHFVVPNANSVAILVRPREGIDEASTRRLVDSVRQAVRESGLNNSRATTTGVPAITAALTNEASSEMPLLGGLAVLVLVLRFLIAPASTSWLRRLWPLLAAVIGSVLTLAVFGWAGIPMSVGAIVLFPLLLGIGSSFPLYLANSPNRRRVVVVSAASAIAFGCLAVSPLPFVRELGIALGLGVALTVGATLALERAFGLNGRLDRPSAEAAGDEQATRQTGQAGPRWLAFGGLVAIAAVGWAMLPGLDVQANPEDIARGLPELQQARYAEQVLGSSGEVNVVLRGSDVQSPQALRWMTQAEDVAISRHGDALRPVLTAPDLLNFLGGTPSPEQISAGLQLLPRYLTSAVFSPDGQQGMLTFGLKFQDLGPQSALLDDLKRALPAPPSGSHVEVVGLPVAADRAYQLVSADRYLANVAGIVAAGAVLLIGLRRKRDALSAMLAATMATGWMLAGLWLVGVPLNPLTVALGSLATVTACEFTVLLADSYRRSRLNRMVGWACLTSVIGYLALVPSQIGLLREFGITLAITVLFSYLAALAVVRLKPHLSRRPQLEELPAEVPVEESKPAEVAS
jgi:predicted RND superfamily exporter protein